MLPRYALQNAPWIYGMGIVLCGIAFGCMGGDPQGTRDGSSPTPDGPEPSEAGIPNDVGIDGSLGDRSEEDIPSCSGLIMERLPVTGVLETRNWSVNNISNLSDPVDDDTDTTVEQHATVNGETAWIRLVFTSPSAPLSGVQRFRIRARRSSHGAMGVRVKLLENGVLRRNLGLQDLTTTPTVYEWEWNAGDLSDPTGTHVEMQVELVDNLFIGFYTFYAVEWQAGEDDCLRDGGVPPISDGGTPAWWKTTFVDGRSRYMHRPWNVGFSFYVQGQEEQWVFNMGAWPDTIMGGATGDDRETTWEGLCGGRPDAPIRPVPAKTSPHLASSYHLRAWTCSTCPSDVWAIVGLPTVPRMWKPPTGTYLDGWKAVANDTPVQGFKPSEWYWALGARMRAHIEDIGKDHTKIVLRPNWELNQDTAFMPNPWQNGMWIQLYNKMMKNFITNFRSGFGYRVPVILAFVEETQGCLRLEEGGACNTGTMDSFLEGDAAGLYDLVEVSCHPGIWHAGAEELWIFGPMPPSTDPTKSNNFACEDAFRVARRHGLAAALTEWSPRNELEYIPPRAPETVDMIADMLERNKNILAFSNAFHVSFVLEGWNPYGDPAFGALWQEVVRRHKARFQALP